STTSHPCGILSCLKPRHPFVVLPSKRRRQPSARSASVRVLWMVSFIALASAAGSLALASPVRGPHPAVSPAAIIHVRPANISRFHELLRIVPRFVVVSRDGPSYSIGMVVRLLSYSFQPSRYSRVRNRSASGAFVIDMFGAS